MKKTLLFLSFLTLVTTSPLLLATDGLFRNFVTINENPIESRISVFPNPASQSTTIQSTEDNLQIKQVVVYNILGKQVLQKSYSPYKKVNLNVGGLKNGQYILLVLLSDDKSETTTLIKI